MKNKPKKDRFKKAIKDAKRVVATWSKQKRASVQLEGTPMYSSLQSNKGKSDEQG